MAESENEVANLLDEFDFDVAAGHLEQAISSHTRGDWASANAQLRSFVEELFDRMASVLSEGDTDTLASSHSRRAWLATSDASLFDPRLNEWDEKGKGFVQGFWRRLHPEGSHPGLSDEADSTFRLQLVIITGAHFLRRFAEMSE